MGCLADGTLLGDADARRARQMACCIFRKRLSTWRN